VAPEDFGLSSDKPLTKEQEGKIKDASTLGFALGIHPKDASRLLDIRKGYSLGEILLPESGLN